METTDYQKYTYKHWRLFLFSVCLLGLILRVPGLFWGVLSWDPPQFVSYVRDEIQMSKLASEFSNGIVFVNEQYYPKGYPFQMAVVSLFIKPFMELNFPELILSGRLLSLVYGLGTIFLLFVLVKEVTANARLALFSSLCLALAGGHVIRSHLATPDVAVTFWIYALMYYALLYIRTKRNSYFALLLISTGVALAIKMSIIAPIPILYIAVKDKWNARTIGLTTLALLVLFAVGNGGRYEWSTFVNTLHNVLDDNINERQFNKWLNLLSYSVILIVSLGLPVFLLVLRGLGQILHSPLRLNFVQKDIIFIIVLPLILHFISICFISYPASRHYLPIIPFFCVLAAVGIVSINKIKFWQGQRFSILVFFIILYQIVSTGSLEYNCVVDTREVATKWFRKNIPTGESIALPKYSYMPALEKDYKVVDIRRAQYLILHEAYYARYHKSIVNPFNPFPKWEEVGNAEPNDFRIIQEIFHGESDYKLIKTFEIKALSLEQIVFHNIFGNLWDGFIGNVLIYRKESRSLTVELEQG